MREHYVIDTVTLISCYYELFNRDQILSSSTYHLVNTIIKDVDTSHRLTIPSVVFIEIYKKWFNSEEFAQKFYYEAFLQIINSPNIEIRALDKEIIELVLTLDGVLENHEVNDKIVVASALALDATLITTDTNIITFAESNPDKLSILS